MSENKRPSIETLDKAKIYSNVKYPNLEIDIHYGVATDSGIVDTMQADGKRVQYSPGTSYEYVGDKTKEKEPAKIIIAENGNIHFEAENGDIILKAKNIRIVAEDGSGEVTINSGKILELRAPILKESSTNSTSTTSANREELSGTKSDNSQVSNQTGTATDAEQGSFLGRLFSGFKSLKKFFTDVLL